MRTEAGGTVWGTQTVRMSDKRTSNSGVRAKGTTTLGSYLGLNPYVKFMNRQRRRWDMEGWAPRGEREDWCESYSVSPERGANRQRGNAVGGLRIYTLYSPTPSGRRAYVSRGQNYERDNAGGVRSAKIPLFLLTLRRIRQECYPMCFTKRHLWDIAARRIKIKKIHRKLNILGDLIMRKPGRKNIVV